jgi:hypothetical protein
MNVALSQKFSVNDLDCSWRYLLIFLDLSSRAVVFDVPLFFPELNGVNIRGVALTVSMPTFDTGAYIECSIRSTLSQTFSDFELIVSGNKSVDLPWITLLTLAIQMHQFGSG